MRFGRLLVFALCTASALLAERGDVVLSAGVGLNESTDIGVAGVRISSGRAAAQVNPSVSLGSAGPGRFALEFPIMVNGGARVLVNRDAVSSADLTWSFVPGVRYHLMPDRRLSPFGAFGVGVGRASEVVVGRNIVSAGSGINQLTIGYGGGLDLRVVGPLKLRAELRNHAVRHKIGAVDIWDNRPMFLAGIGLGF